ncbi:MAG: hypothetical protein ACXWE9_12665 [Methylobacter sp.]
MKNVECLVDAAINLWTVLCLTILVAYCLWSMDRGLDLSDESYYLAVAIHPDKVMLWATAMHWMTSALWRLSGSLTGFRALGMAILSASAIVLALGAAHAFEQSGPHLKPDYRRRLLIIALGLAGALLYHAFVPFTPSYNLLAVSGIYSAVGLTCFTANRRDGLAACLQVFAGMALGMAFLAKFSSGTFAWAIVCAISAVYGNSFRSIVFISTGMAATVATFVLLHGSFGEALSQFESGTRVYMLGANETFPGRLQRYVVETGDFLKLILSDFSMPLLMFVIHAIRPRPWIALTGFALFGYIVVTRGYLLGGMDKYEQQTAALAVVVVLSLLAVPKDWWKNRKAVCLFTVLALLPFGIAIGTFNALHTQILFSLAPWGVLTGLSGFGAPKASSRYEALLIAGFFILIASSQVVTNGLRAPYRQYRPLLAQTETVYIPLLGTIRVDHETKDSYLQLEHLTGDCGLNQSEPFLGLYNIPGVALLLHATPIGMPLLQDRLSTEAIFEHLSEKDLRSAVLGIDRDTESYDSGMPRQLAAFPKNYRSCGTVIIPYRNQKIELWVRSD